MIMLGRNDNSKIVITSNEIKYIIFILLLSFQAFKIILYGGRRFVQSTVNKASSVLSTEMKKKKYLNSINCKRDSGYKGIGLHTWLS